MIACYGGIHRYATGTSRVKKKKTERICDSRCVRGGSQILVYTSQLNAVYQLGFVTRERQRVTNYSNVCTAFRLAYQL